MRTTVSALALLAMIAPAAAADVYSSAKDPVTASYSGPVNWTGFYLGVNGGYGENASSRDSTLIGDATISGKAHEATLPLGGADPTGFLFGGQIGYLYQPQGSNFVFGGEFAFDGSNITGDKTANPQYATVDGKQYSIPAAFGLSTGMHQQLDWIGTLTGVGGLTLGNAMVYGKAGLAFGQVQESAGVGVMTMPNLVTLSRTGTDTGWTAGLGVAYKFTPNWSFALEGDYFDLGDHSMSVVDTFSKTPVTIHTSSISEDFWTIKAAVNYQVTGAYQSLK